MKHDLSSFNFNFNFLHEDYDEIRRRNSRVNNEKKNAIINKINSIKSKYPDHRKIEDLIKIPTIFNNTGKRSFATLLYNGVVPELQSGFFGQLDENYYDMCLDVFNKCVSRLPICEDDFSKIFSFMGAVPLPITIPPPSTGIIRENQGLNRDPSDEVISSLEKYISNFFSEVFFIPDNFVFKIASTGNPGFPEITNIDGAIIDKTSSPYPEEAFRIFKKAQAKRINTFLKEYKFKECLLSNDLETLYNDYELLYFFTDQHRGQPDRSSKERKGYTMDNWDVNHDQRNKEFLLDKEIAIKEYYSNFSSVNRKYGQFDIRSRKWRFVFAESSSTNTLPNLILSCIRENYGNLFKSTFKCGDHVTVNKTLKEYIAKFNIDLRRKDIFCFDISQFDNSISPKMLEAYIRGIASVSPELANELAKLSTCPGMCSVPYINLDPRSSRNTNYLLGNPFNIQDFTFGTSPSGTADVSEKAKLICSFFVLYHFFRDDWNKIKNVLKGQDETFLFFNLGDNNFIVADYKYKVRETITNSEIFKVDESEELIFGGLRFEVSKSKNSITARPNAGSFLMKILAPERPLDDVMRSDYFLSLNYRLGLAQNDYQIGMVLENIDKVMRDSFGCSDQIDLATRLSKQSSNGFNKSLIYEKMQKYLSTFGLNNLSSYFYSIIESGGDKLFYTDLYESLTDDEKRIVDELFFSTFDNDEIENIIEYFKIK